MRSRPPRADLLIALALLVIGLADLADGSINGNPRGLVGPVVVAIAAAVAWRRSAPLVPPVTLAVSEVVLMVGGTAIDDLWAFVVLLLTSYSVGAHAPQRPALIGAGLVFSTVQAATFLDTPVHPEDFFSPLVIVGGPWLAGRLARRYGEQAAALERANRELEARRAQEVEHALEQERARIAQELHDVIAHSLSVMVVQAGAAEQLAPDGAASEALDSIRRTGKSALAEMRRLLGVLRTDSGLHPQPGVAELPDMVARVRAAGVDVALDVDPALPALQPGPDLVVYRVVQEALTNTLKHAGESAARVTVAYEGGAVAIEAVDTGGAGGSGDGSGHGLLGMRERLALYDGTLESGPADGGWRVRARLPVDAEALR